MCRPTNYSAFVGTYNVHGNIPTESLTPWLLSWANDDEEYKEPDIYIIGYAFILNMTCYILPVLNQVIDVCCIRVRLQEVDLSAEAYVIYAPTRELEWCKAIENGLGELADKYTKVHMKSSPHTIAGKQLIGMLIIVYARHEHAKDITEIGTSSAGCGIMGMMVAIPIGLYNTAVQIPQGNKGGVSIRFKLRDSYLCFVNSHLAAFANQVQRRNQDYAEICRRIAFPVTRSTYNPSGSWLVGGTGSSGSGFMPDSSLVLNKTYSMFDSDHLVWMGDLNYRIGLPAPEIKSLLEIEDLDSLLGFDQLGIEKDAKRTFHDFEEGPITFPPTYKYDEGTNDWDSSEKKRPPAWTDRIMWRKSNQLNGADDSNNDSIKLRSYTSCMEMMMSDHKPVTALFDIKIRTMLKDKQHEVRADVIRQLDKLENESMPDARISSSFINLGNVKYLVPQMTSIVLENVGQAASSLLISAGDCAIQVRPQDEGEDHLQTMALGESAHGHTYARLGLLLYIVILTCFLFAAHNQHRVVESTDISPTTGEQAQITFTALVDNATALALNTGQDKLEDMLVLHLENGKDFFLLIDGSYLTTCFSMSLDLLVRLSKPVRVAVAEAKGRPEQVELVDEESQLSVPKELFRVVDFLWLHGLDVDSLFLVSGDQSTIAYIRECLDTGEEFDLPRLVRNYDPAKQVESIIPLPGSTWGKAPKVVMGAIESLEESEDDILLPTPLIPTPVQDGTLTKLADDIVFTDTESFAASEEPLLSAMQDDEHMGVHSMAEVLVRFLEALPDPVIPFQFYQQCLDMEKSRDAVLNILPNINANVFLYLTGFLREVIAKGSKDGSALRKEKIGVYKVSCVQLVL
ncbi:LOW QUALITY PROTEIN: Endonuclease/exonuclease/phosphatase [Jimgerdemannia flammicorona]|uniref:Endonuclease/exonuclease/phosphatase n=1 Tax=Jimgerdemannia flammicorona TaxID=994334 RepID=A0A433B8Q4_9FUNG|nr:LOW QUALITY PROTEIN: Endonuclease/exonuclease/phosphatase [Jimgerdemannia flammicorona]